MKQLFLGLLLFANTIAYSAIKLDQEEKFQVYGDFRLRLETDWNNQDCDRVKSDDRTRLRVRARVGFQYDHNDCVTMGARVRTGPDSDHQSSNITIIDFNHNDTSDAHFNFDKWFLKVKSGCFWAWAGRETLPMWMQNERFWGKTDVIPAGIAAGAKTEIGKCGYLQFNSGYFSLPVGMKDFSGNLGLGQIVFTNNWCPIGLTLASGVMFFDANSTDPDGALLPDGNGGRDYTVWVENIQIRFDMGDVPVQIGGDLCYNSRNYSATDPNAYTATHRKEKDGWVVSIQAGKRKDPGDWLFRYTYADIDALATSSSYTQSSWVRWGTATDIRGHEFRIVYIPCANWYLLGRVYIVRTKTCPQKGKRARLDCVFWF